MESTYLAKLNRFREEQYINNFSLSTNTARAANGTKDLRKEWPYAHSREEKKWGIVRKNGEEIQKITLLAKNPGGGNCSTRGIERLMLARQLYCGPLHRSKKKIKRYNS